MSKDFITRTQVGIVLDLKVSPAAKRTAIDGAYGESAIKPRVAAPPADGKAKVGIVRFLAELLGTFRSEVSVVQGVSSGDKVVRVRGLGEAKVRKILSSHLR